MALSDLKFRKIIREEAMRVLREQTEQAVDPAIVAKIDQRYASYSTAKFSTAISNALAADPNFKGTWNVAFKINPDGTVVADSVTVTPESPTVSNKAFEFGISSAIKDFKLPAPGVVYSVNKKLRAGRQ